MVSDTRQLEELIRAVEELRDRVAALERGAVSSDAVRSIEFQAPHTSDLPISLSSGLLAGLGRLLLGIAGAYLLRAITESGILPQLAGVLVGLAYACAWLVSSVRIFSKNRLVVGLQGLTAALIAGPLLWEATVRFHSLPAPAAAACIALFIALGQVVAWRRDLSLIAGVIALAGSATAIALITATLDPVPFAIALAVSAAVVEYGASRDRALSLRWIVALAVDFCGFLLVYLTTRLQGLPEGYASVPHAAVIAILSALVAIYAVSTVVRTLIRTQPISWFEIAQVAAVIALAIGGGLRLGGAAVIGASCLVGGALCYLAAFTSRSRNFHAYSTFALLLTGTGCWLLFPMPVRAMLWMLAALTGIIAGEVWNKNTLRLQGAFYLVAAAMITAPGLCAIPSVFGYGVVLWMRRRKGSTTSERVAAAILVALACWSIVRLVHFEGPLSDTLRTVLIAGIGAALAWSGRRWSLAELTWVLYPWMAFGAVKLVAEDFRGGEPAALAVSLLVYGGTLIALPRLARGGAS